MLQVFTALEQAPTLPMQELGRAQHAVQASLALVFDEFRSAGAPLQLPDGITLAAVSVQYAAQILDSIDSAQSPIAEAQRLSCRDCITAFSKQENRLRLRMSAAVAAACVAWTHLPDKVNSLVKPLMAAVRFVYEPALQHEVCPLSLLPRVAP